MEVRMMGGGAVKKESKRYSYADYLSWGDEKAGVKEFWLVCPTDRITKVYRPTPTAQPLLDITNVFAYA